MKKCVLALAIIATTSGASAACFNFVNGNGPRQIGQFHLAGTATSICVKSVNGFAGSHTQVNLFDSRGDLLIASGTGSENQISLYSGNINDRNEEMRGIQIVINTERDSRLGITKGTLSIQAGRDFPQKFVIIAR